MTDQGDGGEGLIPLEDPIRAAPLHKVISQSNPPDSEDNAVERKDPDDNQKSADSHLLPHDWKFTVQQGLTKEASQIGREGLYGEKCYEEREPAVPDDDMQASLKRE
ncbi:MAG: hypothetical protein M1818_002835 [Claussenomyces sp. TS43310]|nr:MAG: hypothetical protein M1818_002835 [Claussenomyces sp. TS43310]